MGLERQYPRKPQDADPSHLARYKFAASKLLPTDRVLDAACGSGYGSELMKWSCKRVYGVDIEPEAIRHAIQFFNANFFQMDVMDVDKIRKDYDVAVSFETIEHLENDVDFLKKLRLVSRKLICSVPNENHYKFDPEVFKEDKYPHLRHYTPDQFRELLTSTGWEIQGEYSQQDKHNPEIRKGVEGRFMVFTAI